MGSTAWLTSMNQHSFSHHKILYLAGAKLKIHSLPTGTKRFLLGQISMDKMADLVELHHHLHNLAQFQITHDYWEVGWMRPECVKHCLVNRIRQCTKYRHQWCSKKPDCKHLPFAFQTSSQQLLSTWEQAFPLHLKPINIIINICKILSNIANMFNIMTIYKIFD